jgi:hypothetical protein
MAEQRFRFVSDDDGHDYLIPADKKEEFDAWLEGETRLWEPGLGREEFERRSAEQDGREDFNDYKIDAHEHYTFERPEVD